jgi:transcription elongation factor Elf1
MSIKYEVFVVCKLASEELIDGYVTGYKCVRCGEELQISPVAAEALKDRGTPFCYPCGLLTQKEIEKMKDPRITNIVVTREMIDRMKDKNHD